jgi:hypothetical protein
MKYLSSSFYRHSVRVVAFYASLVSAHAAPIVQQAYVKAPNSDAADRLGSSVAIFGNTMVVGAPDEDGSGAGANPPADDLLTDSGAAYVYVRNGSGVWTFQAYLKASNPDTNDAFGSAVAIYGDTIVVGARTENGSGTGVNPAPDNLATFAGAAYVFTRSGTTWSQQAYLKASNSGAFDFFGTSVAVTEDTIIVGASGEDGSGTGVNPALDDSASAAGAAYVFTRSGSVWSHQAYLKASNTGADDGFGLSVGLSGDTVIVGAYGEDGSGMGINPASDELATGAGAAYVFTRSGSTWSQQAYLKAANSGAGDSFGRSVAAFGEMVAVGATAEDGSGTGVNPASDDLALSSGAVYAFIRSGTTWTQQSYIKASNAAGFDSFGDAVSLSGNVLVVGATGEDGINTGVNPADSNGLSSAGAAYVFLHSGSTWSQTAYLKASQVSNSDAFGAAVAAAGDSVVVSAYNEDGNGNGVNPTVDELATDAGAAYVFSGIDTPEIAVSQNSTDIPNAGSKSFGNVLQGNTADLTFTISNSGAADLTLSGAPLVAVSGPDAAAFTVTSQPTSPVAAAGSTTFTVHFTATTAGTRSALLTILNEDVSESIFRIQLSADVLPPDIAISQQGLNIPNGGSQQLDPVSVGFSSSMTIDITNTGAAPLLLTGSPAVSISGPDAASFSILAQPNTTLPAGVTLNFTLRFTPLDGAVKNALLTIASNDADESPYQISISGQALPPEIQVTQGSNNLGEGCDFGGVILGNTIEKEFTITNVGGATLNLTGSPLISLSGPNANSFSIDQPGTAALPPGGETTFTVSFTPGSLGTKNAGLTILSNDGSGHSSEFISIQGTALNFTNDTDGDGLNDGSELQMAALGFNWNQNQTALVNTLMSNAANAGLYTTSQVQALNVGTPLIQKNATTGAFTLTLGLEKSTNLTSFTALPMTAPQCLINGQGKLEFQFTVPGNTAFFRVQAQ